MYQGIYQGILKCSVFPHVGQFEDFDKISTTKNNDDFTEH